MVDNLTHEAKLLADESSLFSVVYDESVTAQKLNKAVQVIFTHKSPKPPHPLLYLSQAEVLVVKEHKHLGMILDSKLDFSAHVKEAIVKARRGIGMMHYMAKYVSRDVHDQIYKLYVRPHLDYDDIIYHKHDPEFTHDMTKRLERI